MALRPVQVTCWTVGLASLAGIAGLPAPSAHPRDTQVTWTTDVEPILKARCVGCHATDGFGPMPLATYQDARAWASAIRGEVLERRMPPWPAARGFGDYANDRSLSPFEIELVAAWAGGGTPLGPPVPVRGEMTVRPDRRRASLTPISVDSAKRPREQRAGATGVGDRVHRGSMDHRLGVQARQSIARHAGDRLDRAGNRAGHVDATGGPDSVSLRRGAAAARRITAGPRAALPAIGDAGTRPERAWPCILASGRRASCSHRRLTCGTASIDREIEVLAVTPRAAGAGDPIEVSRTARWPRGAAGRRAEVSTAIPDHLSLPHRCQARRAARDRRSLLVARLRRDARTGDTVAGVSRVRWTAKVNGAVRTWPRRWNCTHMR